MHSSRHDREQALRAYDDESLKVAYRIAARLPLDHPVVEISRDQMIAFILKSEDRK